MEGERLRLYRCETPRACFHTSGVTHRLNGPAVNGDASIAESGRWDAAKALGDPWQGGQSWRGQVLRSVGQIYNA